MCESLRIASPIGGMDQPITACGGSKSLFWLTGILFALMSLPCFDPNPNPNPHPEPTEDDFILICCCVLADPEDQDQGSTRAEAIPPLRFVDLSRR